MNRFTARMQHYSRLFQFAASSTSFGLAFAIQSSLPSLNTNLAFSQTEPIRVAQGFVVESTQPIDGLAAPGFTLEQLIALCNQSHPRIRAAAAEENAAAQSIIAAGLWQNPIVDYGHVKGVQHNSYDRAGTPTLVVSQFIESGGVPQAKQRVAFELFEAAKARRETVQRKLALDVEENFIALQAQCEIIRLNALWKARLESASKIVELRLTAGTTSGYDTRRLQIATAEAVSQLQSALAEANVLRGRLNVAIGPCANEVTGDPILEDVALPEIGHVEIMLDEMEGSQTQLAEARANQRASIAEVDVVRRQIRPGFELRGLTGYGQSPSQLDFGAGIAFPLPINNRGQGSIASAQRRATGAGFVAEAVRLESTQRIRALYEAAAAKYYAAQNYLNQTQSLDEKLVTESEARYRDGKMTILELVDALSSASLVQIQRVSLFRDARLAEITLRREVFVGSEH